MRVREIMTKDPAFCVPTDSVQRAAREMKDLGIGAIPVLVDPYSRRMEGIVTDRDLCCKVVSEAKDPHSTRVGDVLSKPAITCGPDDSVEYCATLFRTHQIRRVPVVNDQGECIGIVAQADLARRLPPELIGKTVAAISQPGPVAAAA